MTGGNYRNAGVEVKVMVTIDIPHVAAKTALHNKWIDAAGDGGKDIGVTSDYRLGSSPGSLYDDPVRCCLRHIGLLA
jgi:hypothetical protein